MAAINSEIKDTRFDHVIGFFQRGRSEDVPDPDVEVRAPLLRARYHIGDNVTSAIPSVRVVALEEVRKVSEAAAHFVDGKGCKFVGEDLCNRGEVAPLDVLGSPSNRGNRGVLIEKGSVLANQ